MEVEVTEYVIKVDIKQSLGTPKHKAQNCTTSKKVLPTHRQWDTSWELAVMIIEPSHGVELMCWITSGLQF